MNGIPKNLRYPFSKIVDRCEVDHVAINAIVSIERNMNAVCLLRVQQYHRLLESTIKQANLQVDRLNRERFHLNTAGIIEH